MTLTQEERDRRWAERERKMDIMGKIAFVLGVAVLALVAIQFASEMSYQTAMESCMNKGFSYDTCFLELNR